MFLPSTNLLSLTHNTLNIATPNNNSLPLQLCLIGLELRSTCSAHLSPDTVRRWLLNPIRHGKKNLQVRFNLLIYTIHHEWADSSKLSAASTDFPIQSITSSLTAVVNMFGLRDAHPLADGDLGGRTAWSATVTIQGQNMAARFWYDGQYLNNAKEDAAEVACTKIRNPAIVNNPNYRPAGWTR